MQGFLSNIKGEEKNLPVLLSWDISYGRTLPCDAFEISFLFAEEMLPMLEEAMRFRGTFKGETVFVGVVDEFEVEASEWGNIVFVRGRGLAALLLDNEVETAEFYSAGLEQILEKYVYPFGIKEVEKLAGTNKMPLKVESGSSCWRVLEDFLWFGSGLRPYFDPKGRLVIGEKAGLRRRIDKKSAVELVKIRNRRYGVISRVLVKNKAAGFVETVENDQLIKRGGCCQRVINVPRYTGFDSMRMTGRYQIERSQEDELLMSVRMPGVFGAFPGDIIELRDNKLGADGDYLVGRSRCFASGETAGTEIYLTKRMG